MVAAKAAANVLIIAAQIATAVKALAVFPESVFGGAFLLICALLFGTLRYTD